MFEQYPDYISEKRRPVTPPESIVDKDGKAVFGTFDKSIPNLNMLDCVKPANVPHCMNKIKLTVWEALELHFDDFIFLTAVYNIGIGGFSIFVYFDKATKEISSWMKIVAGGKRAKVAENMLNGSYSELIKGDSLCKIVNNLERGEATGKGNVSGKKGDLSFDVRLKTVTEPSIVNIPFDTNRPLYSEKDMFTVDGWLEINGKRYQANENTFAIIDDHKGYYPKPAHYDWLTTMGLLDIDGEKKPFGFNLTRNQSTNQDDYNENLLWFKDASCPLPPVFFTHDKDVEGLWHIKDEHGCVNLDFAIDNQFKIVLHLGIISMDYYLPFGKITGTMKDTDGKTYTLDGVYGLGEDKTTVM